MKASTFQGEKMESIPYSRLKINKSQKTTKNVRDIFHTISSCNKETKKEFRNSSNKNCVGKP